MSLRVGIVGTGEMGRPVAERLARAGHHVSAYVRRADAAAELAAGAIEVVDSLADLGSSDIVIVYVYSDEQVREVAIDGGLVAAMTPSSTLVIHTTGSPTTARAVAEVGAAYGVGVIDAPGSGGPDQAAAGTLNLFAGGSDADVERCQELFAAYATTVTHFGPVGAGQAVKLINNLLFGCHVELALEAARLGEQFGVEATELSRVLHTCSGASLALDLIDVKGSAQNLLDSAAPYVHKDVITAREVAADAGVALGSFGLIIPAVLERTGSATKEQR